MADTNGTYRVQYAALPYRVRQDGEVQLRLVTSRETRRWVIPKGWPMKGIPPHKAAAREAYEEAGLLGSIASTPIGIYRYDKRLSATRSVLCEVMVFPMKVKRYLKKWPERSQRVGFWFSIETAASVVQEPELASLILEFGTLMAERHAEKLAETEKAKAKAKTDQELARKKAAPKTATKSAAERAPAPPLPDESAPSQPDDAANGAKAKPKSKPKTKAKSAPLTKAKGEAPVAENAPGIEVEQATVAAGALAVSEVVAEATPNLKSKSKAQPEPESISKPNPKPEPKSKLKLKPKPNPKLKSKAGSEAVTASVLEGEASSTAVLLADQGLLAQVAVAEEPPLADDLATQAVAPKPGAKKSVVKKSASKKASVKKVPAKKPVAEKAPDKLAEGGAKGGAEGRSELDRATAEVPVDAMEPEAVLPTQSTAPERARKKATAK